MIVKVTQHVTHGDKTYEAGDTVSDAKVAKVLLAAGVAVEKTETAKKGK
ncbi:MAG: hypothetical protein R8M45_11350 [Ghiorsea sp.]